MRTELRSLAVLAALLALCWQAMACGSWPPKHGGQMNYDPGEVSFELVSTGRAATFYLEDHGQPIAATQVQGTVRVHRGTAGWTGALKAAGDNRVVVQLAQPLQQGDEVTADLQFANGTIAQGRFVVGVDVQLKTRFGAPRGFAAAPALR